MLRPGNKKLACSRSFWTLGKYPLLLDSNTVHYFSQPLPNLPHLAYRISDFKWLKAALSLVQKILMLMLGGFSFYFFRSARTSYTTFDWSVCPSVRNNFISSFSSFSFSFFSSTCPVTLVSPHSHPGFCCC